jgi:NADH-ubiquinone oxidoreductase chain 3
MTSTTFFFIFIPLLAIILLAVNLIFAPHNPYQEKDSAFECGFHSFLGQNRTQFSISFFIFALLFLLFDLEILLVYPYVVSAYINGIYGLVIMLIFFLALTLGFAFELGKNALKIESRQTIIANDSNLTKNTYNDLKSSNKKIEGIIGSVILESSLFGNITSLFTLNRSLVILFILLSCSIKLFFFVDFSNLSNDNLITMLHPTILECVYLGLLGVLLSWLRSSIVLTNNKLLLVNNKLNLVSKIKSILYNLYPTLGMSQVLGILLIVASFSFKVYLSGGLFSLDDFF